ncbi:MAG TPA: recombinase family protein [Candidatus Absconditabacterales bacterium]|nr:recombinase family protein [Candidatus Absconditabacterales bacterium]
MYKQKIFQNKSNDVSKKVALIYCRVSSKKQQVEQFGLETQEVVCKERCERNGVEAFKIIKDGGISGGTFERDGFDEVLEILSKQTKRLEKREKLNKKRKHGEPRPVESLKDERTGTPFITHFVCVDGSRISRNDDMAETLFMTNKIRQSGAEIVYVMYPVDYNSSAGMLQENILYAFSAFERRNTRCKTQNGMRSRMIDGYRPFGTPPVGYLREKDGKKSVIVINPIKGPVLKEALEMYANGMLPSESAVFKYLKDKGVKSNSKNNTKGELYKTIVEDIFTETRLYFMAGYIFYPPRGINELIPAKHEALIDMDTVKKIFHRMKGSPWIGKTYTKENPDFPLRDFIYCGHCKSKLTGYRAKGRSQKYPYYGCANKRDTKRFQVNRDIMHEQFDDLLSRSTVNEDVRNLIEETIIILWEHRKEHDALMKQDRIKSLEEVSDKMKRIRTAMLTTTNSHLIQELEGEWELTRQEKENIEKDIENEKRLSEEELKELLVQAKRIYMGPKMVWELSNVELKKVLVNLLFGDKLFYDKEKGFRTAGNTLYDAVLSAIQGNDFLDQSKNKK